MKIKEIIKNSLQKLGYEVKQFNIHTSERALMKKLLQHFQVDLVVDVGANVGQYAVELMTAGYRGPIISFEPIRESFDRLKSQADLYDEWEVFHAGVGNKIQELEINVSHNLVSSSILDVTKASVEAEPATKYARREKINIVTLDSFFGDRPIDSFQSPLLKLDVQGFEMQVLQGASSVLPKVKLIQSELSFVSLYEGGALYEDIFSFMKKNNFEIYTIMPGFRDPESGRMLQADGIFINTRF